METTFDDLCKVAVKCKKLYSTAEVDDREFEAWLLRQIEVIYAKMSN